MVGRRNLASACAASGRKQMGAHDRFLLTDLIWRLSPLRQGYGGQGRKKSLALIPAFLPR
jgi:hypothetical protein